jgi:hypothetical protein
MSDKRCVIPPCSAAPTLRAPLTLTCCPSPQLLAPCCDSQHFTLCLAMPVCACACSLDKFRAEYEKLHQALKKVRYGDRRSWGGWMGGLPGIARASFTSPHFPPRSHVRVHVPINLVDIHPCTRVPIHAYRAVQSRPRAPRSTHPRNVQGPGRVLRPRFRVSPPPPPVTTGVREREAPGEESP